MVALLAIAGAQLVELSSALATECGAAIPEVELKVFPTTLRTDDSVLLLEVTLFSVRRTRGALGLSSRPPSDCEVVAVFVP